MGEEGQPKACWHLFQHCKLPGSPFCWTTEQKAGEEYRLLPVELRAGLPHPRPLLSHLLPLLLIVIAGAGGAAYFAAIKNETRKIAIAGHEVTLAQQYAAIATASIPFFLLAGAGGIVFWVLGAALFFITAHAAFYNYDALEVAEDQEQLVGAIVEEV